MHAIGKTEKIIENCAHGKLCAEFITILFRPDLKHHFYESILCGFLALRSLN